ncbi:hypothetical protein DICPUDRAFT_29501 [Dictyostelium purpureum]|uniref:Uncharacterized protein n=1 Tax=Dictyostelium purpureum TaxID=5786 RepID=F0ZDL8_DICPU|nr:uncharacterized protein DICPUDRAFT_29501 [Dictyostelium purpureum]EGC37935.1 hypothetical protein DICPUDRAFT_29501 [Dictyostelium purpureum]|eukprot:XP_003285506.1 hypothetical protein DICPUDRAFT_29501 [Dictyostelium purpureum]
MFLCKNNNKFLINNNIYCLFIRNFSKKIKKNENKDESIISNSGSGNGPYVTKEYDSYKIHKPVFIKEVLEILDPKPNNVYIDATFGLGGHSRGILESCKDCYVIAFDRDPNVFELTKDLRTQYKDRLITIGSRFSSMKSALKDHNLENLKISGILFDYGVSSYQIDTAERGFSFKKELEGPLDMRMNNKNTSQLSAADIVNTFSEQELRDIFYHLGEEKHTRKIAHEILRKRAFGEKIETTSQLVKVVECCMPYPAASKTISRIFRSLRMYVNDELGEIKYGLREADDILSPGSPLLAISFHSMEDRIVKQYLNNNGLKSDYDTINNNNVIKYELPKSSKHTSPIFPSDEELEWNPRSKSAILRWAVRTQNK